MTPEEEAKTPSVADQLRNKLWDSCYYLWYYSKYNEELSTRMVDRLKGVDDVTKTLVALTASGSVVAGWTLWSEEGLSIAWASMAGTGAVLSIVHSALGVPARLKEWIDTKKDFGMLRSEVESLRRKMVNHAEFEPDVLESAIEAGYKRFAEVSGRIPSDLFSTKGLRNSCQSRVDQDVASTSSLTKGNGES